MSIKPDFAQAVRSPLGIVGLFMALVEAIVLIAANNLTGQAQMVLIWFAALFPIALLIGFFVILWNKAYVFYPPSEYSSGEDARKFADAIRGSGPDKAASNLSHESDLNDEVSPKLSPVEDLHGYTDEFEEDEGDKEFEHVEESKSWELEFWAEDYKTALDIIRERLQDEDDPGEKLRLRATEGYIQGHIDISAGLSDLARLREEHPGFSDGYQWAANLYVREGQFQEAISILTEGLNQIPSEEQHGFNNQIAGIYELNLQDHDAAIQAAQVARTPNTSKEDRARSFRTEAVALRNKEEPAAAMESLRSAYWSAPSDILNIELLMRQFEHLDRKGELLYLRKRLTELTPDSSIYWGHLGNEYLDAGFNDLAMEAYRQADRLLPDQSWIVANIGNLYNNTKLHSLAAEHLKRALELDPDSSYSQERLSSSLQNQVSVKKAAEKNLNATIFAEEN